MHFYPHICPDGIRILMSELCNKHFTISMTSSRSHVHHRFSRDEDNRLLELVRSFGTNQWERVGSLMNRSARQCKDRYELFISPDIRHDPWTATEDEQLLRCQEQFGRRWPYIAQYFSGRSPMQLKNRWIKLDRARRK